jgi:hypothetical protein
MFTNKNRIDCSAKIGVLLKFNLNIFYGVLPTKFAKMRPLPVGLSFDV